MPDDRNRRARELLESRGGVLFFKERQLMKENRFPEAVAIIRRRLRHIRMFVILTTVLVTALFFATLHFDPDPSWMDLGTIVGMVVLIAATEYNTRRVRSALSEVESLFAQDGRTGSDDV